MEVVAWPNPNPTRLSLRVEGKVSGLKLKVYSVSWQMLQATELGTVGPGWDRVDLPRDLLAHCANGIYFFRLVGAEKSGASSVGKFLILR